MKKSPTTLIVVLAVVAGFFLACLCVGVIVLPAMIQQARESQRRQQVANNLKQLSLAMKNYNDTHTVVDNDSGGSAPPHTEDELLPPHIKKLALQFKDEWVDEHPDEEVTFKKILKTEKAASSWHVVFSAVTLPGQSERDTDQVLHIHMDGDGKLIRAIRGPDNARAIEQE